MLVQKSGMTDPIVYRIVELPYEHRNKRKVPREYFVVPYKNKKQVVYFPLKGLVSLVNKSFVDRIRNEDPVVNALFELVEKHDSVGIIGFPEFPEGVTLDLTKDCNLKCIYCYAHGGSNPDYMTWKTAKAAIDWTLKRCEHQKFQLQFHGGGEPTLAFPMMKKSYDYAEERCNKKRITLQPHITTNGMLTEAMVKWFKKINMQVILSFDGLPEVQNKQRPLKNGGPSYDTVKSTIKLLNKYEIDYRVNSVITENSVSKMSGIVEHMKELDIKNGGFSYSWEFGRGLENCVKEPDYPRYIKELELAKRSEERRVGKECRSRLSPDH